MKEHYILGGRMAAVKMRELTLCEDKAFPLEVKIWVGSHASPVSHCTDTQGLEIIAKRLQYGIYSALEYKLKGRAGWSRIDVKPA